MGQKLIVHFNNVKGVKTIIKSMKKFDKDLIVRDYKFYIVVESENMPHYVICNAITNRKMCLHIFRGDDDLYIPLDVIDTIFR